MAPWVVVFDDHEVENNWADEVRPRTPAPAGSSPGGRRPSRRTTRTCRCAAPRSRAARTCSSTGGCSWGRLATFHMLDTRQYRDDQACGDGYRDCPARDRPGPLHHRRGAGGVAARRVPPLRRPLGHPRPAGLLRPSGTTTLGPASHQHGRLGRLRRLPRTGSPGAGWTPGCATRWCSPATCTRTGPATSSWTTPTRPRAPSAPNWSAPRSPRPGTGADSATGSAPVVRVQPAPALPERPARVRPHARSPRGQLTADFEVLPYVSRPGAPAYTRASFVVEDRVPGLHQTGGQPGRRQRSARHAGRGPGRHTVERRPCRAEPRRRLGIARNIRERAASGR